ncbi:hypothetical protein [Lactococcus lactis]|uniref:hypothetical protein n=1 Tax=Lactococcus lactis TaxID=1358 RepID=UPI00288FD0C2|nr:hypothetical protein [Lactococcus lactis]MDT2897168.1 hypothetical protein [Lactococcus lactis]MDT2948210.1 hypothetical protein [Lactococcus lactis]MDT2969405.1 hypothetical protein [Lactococcus lactis]
MIDSLGLEQREYDGSYYDKRGELAVFYIKDGKKFDGSHRLLIRKKILDEFLDKNELVIFWTCLSEKNFIIQEMQDQEWSEWGGLMHYSDGTVIGAMNQYEKKK